MNRLIWFFCCSACGKETLIKYINTLTKVIAAQNNFVLDQVEKLYSKAGRKSIDPVVLVKIHILKFLFNVDSLRRIYEDIKYNILYRWFIGYELGEKVPDHSTYSQNYKRKFCKLENL